MDITGSSDPYVKIKLLDSKVIKDFYEEKNKDNNRVYKFLSTYKKLNF